MNEENNNFEIEFNKQQVKNDNEKIYIPEDIIGTGNIISDDIIVDDTNSDEEVTGPVIVNNEMEEENVETPIIFNHDDYGENIGPVIVNPENNITESDNKQDKEVQNIDVNEEKMVSTESFKELEEDIKRLNDEKEDVENKIQDLKRRKDEIEILIKNKQEELEYKKEVEVTTDKLKTYIRDLEVKPSAVRDALATLINNMND